MDSWWINRLKDEDQVPRKVADLKSGNLTWIQSDWLWSPNCLLLCRLCDSSADATHCMKSVWKLCKRRHVIAFKESWDNEQVLSICLRRCMSWLTFNSSSIIEFIAPKHVFASAANSLGRLIRSNHGRKRQLNNSTLNFFKADY